MEIDRIEAGSRFQVIEPGTTFESDGFVYMRLKSIQDSNAVNLSSGYLRIFSGGEIVRIVPYVATRKGEQKHED